jgi:hypothetical protein
MFIAYCVMESPYLQRLQHSTYIDDQTKENNKYFRASRKSCGQSKLGRHFIEQHDIPPSSAAGAGADHRRHFELRRNTDSLFLSNVFDASTQLHALVIQEKLDQVASNICVLTICYTISTHHLL